MKESQLVDLFQRARSDSTLAVIEGVQALKHASRFKAEIEKIITCDIHLLETLLDELAPDVKDTILSLTEEVPETTFARLSPQPPRTKTIALAKRRSYAITDLDKLKPVVLLEDPRDLENIGAVIRVAAAADVAGVCITGPADIWHPAVIRGAAGLHFALPVINIESIDDVRGTREVVALDPTGSDITKKSISSNAVLLFGTERHGISPELLQTSDEVIRLPMKAGVSSLNLATSVAATLYSIR
jgi:TrmH family RNA methyltransferase